MNIFYLMFRSLVDYVKIFRLIEYRPPFVLLSRAAKILGVGLVLTHPCPLTTSGRERERKTKNYLGGGK